MRDTFVNSLLNVARNDKRVTLVTGDLGFGVLNAFSEQLPTQYINAGVAEQNMTGLAAGMALEGKIVFTYSIANFNTIRCLEQIRNDVIYHDANVKVVSVGGGFSYGALGMSHHATEDVAIMRALPGIRIYAPCDDLEAAEMAREMVEINGPCYLRLDKSKVPLSDATNFSRSQLRLLRAGDDIALIGYGGILGEALHAGQQLEKYGISCAVYSAHTLRPFDVEALGALADRYSHLVTIEEHLRTGGLGSLIADLLFDIGKNSTRLCRIALPDSYSSIVGSQDYLRARFGINASGVVSRIRAFLE